MDELRIPRLQGLDQVDERAQHDRVEPAALAEDRQPAHLGITEAGTKWSGSLKSAVGLGTLLADGVGDTIRISLSTFHAEEEVKVAWEILKALKLRERGPVLIACPTCGRLQFDMDTVVAEIEERLRAYDDPIEVAVLGCAVNGIGEASHADFGITGAKNEGLLRPRQAAAEGAAGQLVDALFAEIDKSIDRGTVLVDEGEAAEGAEVARRSRPRTPASSLPSGSPRWRRRPRARTRSGATPACRWRARSKPSGSRSTRTPRRPRDAASARPEQGATPGRGP